MDPSRAWECNSRSTGEDIQALYKTGQYEESSHKINHQITS